jgi:hypothetical protein
MSSLNNMKTSLSSSPSSSSDEKKNKNAGSASSSSSLSFHPPGKKSSSLKRKNNKTQKASGSPVQSGSTSLSSSNSRPESKGGKTNISTKAKGSDPLLSVGSSRDGSGSIQEHVSEEGKEEKKNDKDHEEEGRRHGPDPPPPESIIDADDHDDRHQDEIEADDNDRTASSDGDLITPALIRLSKVNEIRGLYLREDLPANDENLSWVLSGDVTHFQHSTCFFSEEWTEIQSQSAQAKAKAAKRMRSTSPPNDSNKLLKSDILLNDEEEEMDEAEDGDDDDSTTKKSLNQEANRPLKPEVAALLPPTWVGPDQQHTKETTVQKERREKAAPIWAKVPLITDIKERRKLIRQHAFHVDSKGVATHAAVKMPTSLDPSKDLKKQGISKKQDSSTSLVCEMLTKDWPTMITRNSDVLRVLLTAINLWNERSQEENLDLVTKVVLPLLIDNNLRATDAMNRATIKIAYPQAGKLPDEPSRSSSSAQTPLMQQLLAENTEHQDLEKAMKKAMPSLRGTSSYRSRGSSNRGRIFKRGSSRPMTSSSSTSSSPYRGRGGRGRGSSSSRGTFRGGKNKFSSSASSKEESSI